MYAVVSKPILKFGLTASYLLYLLYHLPFVVYSLIFLSLHRSMKYPLAISRFASKPPVEKNSLSNTRRY